MFLLILIVPGSFLLDSVNERTAYTLLVICGIFINTTSMLIIMLGTKMTTLCSSKPSTYIPDDNHGRNFKSSRRPQHNHERSQSAAITSSNNNNSRNQISSPSMSGIITSPVRRAFYSTNNNQQNNNNSNNVNTTGNENSQSRTGSITGGGGGRHPARSLSVDTTRKPNLHINTD